MELAIGDLVYDNRYLGMIVAINAEDNSVFYEVEWYAANYAEIDRLEDYSRNRTAGFRNTYLKARKNGKIKPW
jgi:hypothetical protein